MAKISQAGTVTGLKQLQSALHQLPRYQAPEDLYHRLMERIQLLDYPVEVCMGVAGETAGEQALSVSAA